MGASDSQGFQRFFHRLDKAFNNGDKTGVEHRGDRAVMEAQFAGKLMAAYHWYATARLNLSLYSQLLDGVTHAHHPSDGHGLDLSNQGIAGRPHLQGIQGDNLFPLDVDPPADALDLTLGQLVLRWLPDDDDPAGRPSSSTMALVAKVVESTTWPRPPAL